MGEEYIINKYKKLNDELLSPPPPPVVSGKGRGGNHCVSSTELQGIFTHQSVLTEHIRRKGIKSRKIRMQYLT
jgi:hypothetical protein